MMTITSTSTIAFSAWWNVPVLSQEVDRNSGTKFPTSPSFWSSPIAWNLTS